MDIVFAGICCWVDSAPPKQGKTVIIRNALNGGLHDGVPIPAHWAFVHAKHSDIDTTNWPVSLASEDNVFFFLNGDYLEIDPKPGGGSIDISLLPHVKGSSGKEPICPKAERLRTGFRDEPTTDRVLALLDLPPDAQVSCAANANQAIYATLHMPDAPVTITATPFADSPGSPRSLTIRNPNAEVFIANVHFTDYLMGVGAREDDHKYLVCDLFKPVKRDSAVRRDTTANGTKVPIPNGISLSEVRTAHLDNVSIATLQRAAGRGMPDFLNTLAAGCSDSQWP